MSDPESFSKFVGVIRRDLHDILVHWIEIAPPALFVLPHIVLFCKKVFLFFSLFFSLSFSPFSPSFFFFLKRHFFFRLKDFLMKFRILLKENWKDMGG